VNKFNSHIKLKTCKCGCGKNPTIGCNGFNVGCNAEKRAELATKRNEGRIKQRKTHQERNRALRLADNSKVMITHTKGQKTPKSPKKQPKHENVSKSVLLREADSLYSRALRNEAADQNGDVICPLCNIKYNLTSKNADGEVILQCLHYVDRSVYSLRWDRRNTICGCGYCNFGMFIYGEMGRPHRIFREILVEKYGEQTVSEMENEKRKINKLELSTIQEIINKYKP